MEEKWFKNFDKLTSEIDTQNYFNQSGTLSDEIEIQFKDLEEKITALEERVQKQKQKTQKIITAEVNEIQESITLFYTKVDNLEFLDRSDSFQDKKTELLIKLEKVQRNLSN